MADTRERPGWLPCTKLAVNSKISIWFEPGKALDCFTIGAGGTSNHCAESLDFSVDAFVCEISKTWGTSSMTALEAATSRMSGRTAGVIIICGCLMAVLSFGPRSALGFFLTPMSEDNGWGRDVFSLALAVQNLFWGAAQPFAGAIADRYGALRVLAGGAIMYGLGPALMAHSQAPPTLELAARALSALGPSAS